MTIKTKTETDLLIIGAGIAGCIAAIALADRYRISIVDKLSEPVDRIGESLAPAAMRILKELNLFNNLSLSYEQQLFRKNIGMQSWWGSNRVQIKDHLRNPDGLGLNLNRKEFEKYLRQKTLERGVHCLWPVKFYSSSYINSGWEVIFQSSDKNQGKHLITSRYVVDATGRQSHFARSQGVERRSYDKLISCWVSMPDKKDNKLSTISASESGWWYSSVVPDNKRILAFQTDSDLIDRSQIKDLESFLSFTETNDEAQIIQKRSGRPIQFHGTVSANSTRLARVAGNHWIAIGDAAVSFDPLSSQGMFHAMASAMQFKELITRLDVDADLDTRNMERLQGLYSSQIDDIWSRYLRHKTIYYGAEMRWPDSPFWKRRHGSNHR